MGIKNLKKFLTKNNLKGVPLNFSELAYRKIAIDTSIYMYKYKYIYQDSWVMGFVKMITCMRKNDIHPVFVFDGNILPEKMGESERRKEATRQALIGAESLRKLVQTYHETNGDVTDEMRQTHDRLTRKNILLPLPQTTFNIQVLEETLAKIESRAYNVTRSDYGILQEVLTAFQVPYHIASYEAETDCATMFLEKKVDLVATNDTDIFAYGVTHVVMDINTNGSCTYHNLDQILTVLNLTQAQFTDFCIMCGTDYNANIPNIGIVTALSLIQQYGSIDDLPSHVDVSVLSHETIRKIFTTKSSIHSKVAGYCGIPVYEDFVKVLVKYGIKMDYPKLYSNYVRVFE